MTRLILASSSPRRHELLRLLGVSFEIVAPDIDERSFDAPALAKAEAVAAPGVATLAADTEIDLDGRRLGKPDDAVEATQMLTALAGRAHEVVTDVAVIDAAGGALSFSVRSRVTMREADAVAISGYVAGGEPLDKAGAYALQGDGGAFVEQTEGCRANVIGLPLCHTYAALRQAGVATLNRPEEACQRAFSFICPVWQEARGQAHILHTGGVFQSWKVGRPTMRQLGPEK